MTNLFRSRVAVLALIFALLPASAAHAWIEAGHKIIGILVWDQLTPEAQAKATAILKQHPRYKEDLLENLPDGLTPEETDKYAFATAATWPDIVRAQGNPMHQVYNHPDWHFIDLPYVIGNTPMPKDKPSTQPYPHDIVEALEKNVADLKDPGTTPANRAIALCWVLHLGGDIHQPLHCSRMISADYPDGDKGGNNISVLRDPPYPTSRVNLHLLWDELPGEFKSENLDNYMAEGVRHDPKYSREAMKDALSVKAFMSWAQESHALAVQYAYLNGNLKGQPGNGHGGGGADRDRDRGPTPGVPRGYVETAEGVAMKQVALAGYRTADLLAPILGQ